jgi:hypothetical protein
MHTHFYFILTLQPLKKKNDLNVELLWLPPIVEPEGDCTTPGEFGSTGHLQFVSRPLLSLLGMDKGHLDGAGGGCTTPGYFSGWPQPQQLNLFFLFNLSLRKTKN